MGTQQFCLKWNNFSSNLVSVFDGLLLSEAFSDVTLACDGLCLKAHKVILSACSPFFQSLFMANPCKHPIVILNNISFDDLKACVEFMYKGEVNVAQSSLSTLLKTAEALKVKGLAEVSGDMSNNETSSRECSTQPVMPRIESVISTLSAVQDKEPTCEAIAIPGPKSVSKNKKRRRSPSSPINFLKSKKTEHSTHNESESEDTSEEVDDLSNKDSNTCNSRDITQHGDNTGSNSLEKITDSSSKTIPKEPAVLNHISHDLPLALTLVEESEPISEDVKPTDLVSYEESIDSPMDSRFSHDDSNSVFYDSSTAGPSQFQQESRQLVPSGNNTDFYSRNERGLFQCPFCISTSTSTGNLTRHIRRQHGGNKFYCPVCNREFTRADNMKIHLRIHEKPSTNYKFTQSHSTKVEEVRNKPKPTLELRGMRLRKSNLNAR